MNETLQHEALRKNSGYSPTPLGITLNQTSSTQSANQPSVAIMLPTYREAQNIENLIHDIQKLNLNSTIVIIDDSSPDGTANIVRQLQKEYNNIILFTRPAKLGLGTAITAGFRMLLSLETPPDYIITMDSDYSHNPNDIPRLINKALHGFDLTIGSRYTSGGKTIGWPIARRLISHVANLTATIVAGIRVQDCTSGFRCYSKDYVRSVIGNLHSHTYEIQIETVKQAWTRKFRVGEVPIVFSNRKQGKSKLTKTEFRSFLAYIIKTKFGVEIPPEIENIQTKNDLNIHKTDERIERFLDLYRRIKFF